MSDLNSLDRTLIEKARAGDEPTSDDRARVRAALFARIGVGTSLVGTTAITARAATAAVVWPKILATVLVTGAVGGAGVATYRAARPTSVHEVAVSSSTSAAGTSTSETRALPALGGSPAAKLEPPSDPIVSSPDKREAAEKGRTLVVNAAVVRPALPRQPLSWPANTARPSDHALDAPAPVTAGAQTAGPQGVAGLGEPSPASDPAPAAPTSPEESRASHAAPPALAPTTLEAETRLVRDGVTALHSGNASRALALFDEHARAFPRGVLAEERAAERVVALGALQRCDEARAAAADFLTAHPASPLASRVRGACAGAPNP